MPKNNPKQKQRIVKSKKCEVVYMNLKERIMENITESQKYILLLLSANNFEPIKGKLWFQKELFVLSKNIKNLSDDADFEEDLIGPYSEIVDEGLNQLEKIKVVEEENDKLKLTNFGKEVAKEIEKIATIEEREMIFELKKLLNDLTKDELLGFIYFTFGMTKESIEIDRIKSKRKDIALSLYMRNKISIGKASEIAGMSLEDFIEYLRTKGVSRYT